MQEGGCDADAVIAAFKRILDKGFAKREPIDSDDILTVRACGNKLVENMRQKALTVCATSFLCKHATTDAAREGASQKSCVRASSHAWQVKPAACNTAVGDEAHGRHHNGAGVHDMR